MEEIFELCDQVTVFRDGKFVCTEKIVDINLKTLIKQMIGKEVSEKRVDTSSESSGILLEVINFQLEGVLNDINFALKKGEILGIAGLVGSGRSELARAIFGDLRIDSGELKVLGKLVKIHNCHQAIKAGIAFVPEDRKTEGVIAGFSLRNNISMPILQRLRKFGLIFMNIESTIASKYLSELDVKYRSVSQKVSTLSGGNQQRVVLSKWLATNPSILIVDEPTRGIDVAAKVDIHQILIDLSKKGIGILVISSELSELLQLTERILILRRGKIVDSVATNSTSVQDLMELATGEIQVSRSEARND
jgi:ABC-type branched-subunit amino acid transport system ATPase component